MRPLPLLAAAASLAALAAPASAAPSAPPAPPMVLPGAAAAASGSGWIVGARPTARADALARRAGAREVLPGGYAVPRARARALAAALRAAGLLTFAEPDRLGTVYRQDQRAVADDPLSPQARWRDAAVHPSLAPPPVTDTSPLLALIDSRIEAGHPEFAGGRITTQGRAALGNAHGTATAAVAAAPKNDVGILGVWPGMRALNVALPSDGVRCSDSARGIVDSIEAGAAVINMSYGSPSFCYLEYEALQLATARGVTLVAAGGNELADGNPLEFPASLPHVVTVAALTPSDTSAGFSNENAAIDLAAPGVNILTAVPAAYDDDDDARDGWAALHGTSFAAPIVAAAAAWVRAARPGLKVDQVAQVIRLSARDVGREGWEPSTGFGALDLRAALVREAPPRDPKEPNEDIPFVSGAAFGQRHAAIWSGRGRSTLRALLDVFEDPGDVYRLRVPGGRRVRITVAPRYGDPDLEAYAGSARHVGSARGRVARSRRSGRRTETLRLVNRSRRTRTLYVRVYMAGRGNGLDAGYTLRVRRG
ncbi:MAG TPA: S8 family serine peptidase [Solirubrobacteraceae bacterium]|nr:S8 family serine peptidase [Solirubrobacteraceae bacterium]